jgi:hypothetical protein
LKKFAAVIVGVLALVVTNAALAGPRIGFAEDATKYAGDGGEKLFTEMDKLGTTTNRVAVFWNADAPSTIQDQSFLDKMIPVAKKHNVQVVFAIYPLKATQAPTTQAAADSFCNYAVNVMQRYPYVKKVIIGNGGRARELLRQAQGLRLEHRRDRRRALPARQRRPGRVEQLLDLAGAVDRCARQGLSSRSAVELEAPLRRVVVALLPERQHR